MLEVTLDTRSRPGAVNEHVGELIGPLLAEVAEWQDRLGYLKGRLVSVVTTTDETLRLKLHLQQLLEEMQRRRRTFDSRMAAFRNDLRVANLRSVLQHLCEQAASLLR